MKKGRLYNREEIQNISKSILGKSMNDILKENDTTAGEQNLSNKGGLGQMVEQLVFGIQTNSDSEPDFMPAGIELKVTPYKKLKDGKLSAKERLVLNIIDYKSEYKNYEGEYKNYKSDYKNYKGYYKNYKCDYKNYKGDYKNYKCDYKNYKDDYKNYKGDYKSY